MKSLYKPEPKSVLSQMTKLYQDFAIKTDNVIEF